MMKKLKTYRSQIDDECQNFNKKTKSTAIILMIILLILTILPVGFVYYQIFQQYLAVDYLLIISLFVLFVLMSLIFPLVDALQIYFMYLIEDKEIDFKHLYKAKLLQIPAIFLYLGVNVAIYLILRFVFRG